MGDDCRLGGIFTVVGTRPEIIKVAPVLRASAENHVANKMVHTGQHYSYELDSLIFEDLALPIPEYNLKIGSGSHAEETAKALVGLEVFFKVHDPQLVLVQGDTNSALAGALAASKLHIPVGHIEAGLRSFDRKMPEEKNRVLIDHVSDILFAPTRVSAENLAREGIPEARTVITGNTIVDAVNLGLHILEAKSKERITRGSEVDNGFFLMTLHREENVDNRERLTKILNGVSLASSKLDKNVLFPAHPRTVRRIKQFNIQVPDSVHLTQPNGYLDFLQLEKEADLILTDSGGVQEEACILGVPCVTLRDSTERPETVKVGANYLSGNDPKEIASATEIMNNAPRHWENPFGDGKAGVRIVNAILQKGWSGIQ